MRFESPYFLLLILLFLPIFIWAFIRKKPTIIFSSLVPFKIDRENNVSKLARWRGEIPLILEGIAILLLIVALSRPQKGLEMFRQRVEGIDIVIVMDLSGSMTAIDIPKDIKDVNALRRALANEVLKERIDVAKEEIAKFIEKRPDDRIGLVAFGPQAYLCAPPTLDRDWVMAQLQRLKAGEIGDSTNIAAGLGSAISRLKESDAKRKIIVLFTDGKHNVESRITPLQAAQIARDNKIKIYCVGIGSPNAIIGIFDLFGRKQYQPVQFEFDEELLKKIAETTGGRYFAARDAKELEETLQEIDRMEKTAFEAPRYMEYKELAFPLIYSSLLLLLASFLLSNTFMLKLP